MTHIVDVEWSDNDARYATCPSLQSPKYTMQEAEAS